MIHIINQNYNSAKNYLWQLFEKDINNIDALYMRFIVLTTELLDYESYALDGVSVSEYADTVLKIIDEYLLIKGIKEEDYKKYIFFKGNILMSKGLIQAKTGAWIQGIKNARLSVKLLEKLLTLDSTCYDAIIPVGLYNYYVGQNLKWIPFMGLKSKGGLSDIERAANIKSPFSFGAKKSLLEIYIERKQLTKADVLVSNLLEQFPKNTIFLGLKARILFLKQEYSTAIQFGKELIHISQLRNPVNWTDLTAAYHIVISSLYATNKLDQSMQLIETVQNMKIPKDAYKIIYVNKHLKLINGIKEKIRRN